MGRRRNAVTAPAEADIQAAVMAHWRCFGVPGSLVVAVPNARALGMPGLTRGVFDLLVISPTLGDKTGWLELKADGGKLSDAQKAIKFLLIQRGIPHAVCFGRDEPIRILEEWGALRPTVRAAA